MNEYPYATCTRSIPSWVMFGVERPGHVVLFASNELTQAELRSHVLGEPLLWESSPVEWEYVLTTTTSSFVKILAPDWPAAFKGPFARWSPDAQNRDTTNPAGLLGHDMAQAQLPQ
ncbi:hypothetical protein GCM10022243_48340 [Saccharothrix violaceirubra]|uniref:Uncharacterized protein n=1 Tax=Saccharothrix violaceirubra TaxID=413306 RepID=A0A7W7SZL7_9PSEU|nr:hypothetical protein [Saccharothrix violaceirubra]MBB4963824.1 hypothetical protein [Saccharothrix violaceirubra]